MRHQIRLLTIIIAGLLLALAACNLTPEQQQQAAATVSSLGPVRVAELAATLEAASPEQIAALEALAMQAGLPDLNDAQIAAIQSTVVASQATATAVGVAASAGERVNATEVPAQAPQIDYFFAAVPSASGIEAGISFVLNYTTQNANRVEIFGNVMDNPTEGSFPIYGEPASSQWVLWAANDTAWVERSLIVQPDADTGSRLQGVTVDSNNITMTLRDPQLQDGDVVNIDLNGTRVLDRYPMSGRHVSFPLTLISGVNQVVVTAQNQGLSGPMVGEITLRNVTAGPATQLTSGMGTGQSESFTITAP